MNWYKKAQLNKESMNVAQFVRKLRNFNVVKDPNNYKKLINLNNDKTTTVHDWHRGKDINKGLMMKILRDLGINSKDFISNNYSQESIEEEIAPQEPIVSDWQKQPWYIDQQKQLQQASGKGWYKKAQLNIDFWNDCYDAHSGEDFCRIYAEDKNTGDTIGIIDYSIYDDEIDIKMVEVIELYKRQGIGTQMIEYLKNENPGMKIITGLATGPGYPFVQSLKSKKIL